jgi:cytochrome c5
MKKHIQTICNQLSMVIIVSCMVILFCSTPLAAADGKSVYDANCKSCHGQGVGGAPALGDKKGWQSRLEKGIDSMVEIAINGVQGYGGSMPPRGGNANLTDEQVKAAVVYMVRQVQ